MKKLTKTLVLYCIIAVIIFINKPQILYEDNEKTKLKTLNTYNVSKNCIDLCTLPNLLIGIAILCALYMEQ